MASINTESTSKPFSRREWLFAGALVMLIEYWIFSVSHSVSGEQAIVNYVSFASTIASILLAVIAIIYSFVQTDSQQKSGSAIALQIDHLKEVSTQLGNSKEQLEKQLDRVNLVTEKIDDLHELLGGKFNNVEVILSQMRKDISANLKTTVPANPTSIQALTSNTDLLSAILKSTYESDLLTYALNLYAKNFNSTLSWDDFLTKHYATPLASNTENKTDFKAYFYIGIHLLAPLRNIGWLTFENEKLNLSDKFKKYLSEAQISNKEQVTRNLPFINATYA